MKHGAEPFQSVLPATAVVTETRALCAKLVDGAMNRQVFLERCARLANQAVGCSRTGIWLFVDEADGRILRCIAMYDARADRMTHAPDERREVQPYFDALETEGYVSASDTLSHPATAGLFGSRLNDRGVQSLLASSFAVNGHLFGAFTCTQVGARQEWTSRQLGTLRQIGAQASLALFTSSRFTPDTGLAPLLN